MASIQIEHLELIFRFIHINTTNIASQTQANNDTMLHVLLHVTKAHDKYELFHFPNAQEQASEIQNITYFNMKEMVTRPQPNILMSSELIWIRTANSLTEINKALLLFKIFVYTKGKP